MVNDATEDPRGRDSQFRLERAVVRGDGEDVLGRFGVAGGGFELPCVALCAVAS